jgi:hypothetical protein
MARQQTCKNKARTNTRVKLKHAKVLSWRSDVRTNARAKLKD